MKRYIVCQTNVDGKGCRMMHGSYYNIFSAFWKFLKLNFGSLPFGKTAYYVDTREIGE